MLLKHDLTFHSRMSGSRWVTTFSWLFGSLRPFFIYFCVFLPLSVSSVSKSLPFLSFTVSILAWNIPLISPVFLKRSLVFLILLFSLFLWIVHLKRPSYRVWVFLYFSNSSLRVVNVYYTPPFWWYMKILSQTSS